MKNRNRSELKASVLVALIGIFLNGTGWLVTDAAAQTSSNPPAASADLPAGVQDVVALTKAGMGDDLILAKVTQAGMSYNLTADQMIYLKSQGVSEKVMAALIGPSGAPPTPVGIPLATPLPTPVNPPPETPFAPTTQPNMPPAGIVVSELPAEPPPASAPPEINFTYFHDQLAPFGTWVDVPGYGACWYPDKVIAANPDWRPYYDMGHWEYTENGWFWASDYNWGDIPFHYGRWIKTPEFSWLWVPDYTWGPAWVCWRHAEADGYIGWAPLPYGAVWVDGAWTFHGHAVVDAGFDFGLGEDFFVFVANDHFRDERFFRLRGRTAAFEVHRDRIHGFYARTVLRNDYRRDEHGRLVNEGLGRERVERLTQRKVEQTRFEERRPSVRSEHPLAAHGPSERPAEIGHQPGPAASHQPSPAASHPPGPAASHPPGPTASRTPSPAEHPAPAVNKVFRPPVASAPARAAPARPAPAKAAPANSNNPKRQGT